jgi:hypothetical protein
MTTQTSASPAAARPSDEIIGKARRQAHEALDGAADLAREASTAGAAAASAAAEQVETTVRSGLRSARAMAHDARADATGYVRERPLQALLVTAAAVAAVVAIIGLLGRSRAPG